MSSTSNYSKDLNQHHLNLLNVESGITFESAMEANIISVTEKYSLELIGHGGSGIAFPYYNEKGLLIGYRIKQDSPQISEDQKPKKYLTSKGSVAFIYFLKKDLPFLLTSKELVIVEGEKKLLKIRQDLKDQNLNIISIAGCWMFKLGEQEEGSLHPVLEALVLNKEKVTIIPDSDYFTNDKVKIAYNRLAKILSLKGKETNIIDIRISGEEDKMGVDDFLMKKGPLFLISKIKNPFATFKLMPMNEIKNFIEQDKIVNAEQLIRPLIFFPQLSIDSQIDVIRKLVPGSRAADLRRLVKSEKRKFPTKFEKQASIEWDQVRESISDVCKKIGLQLQDISNVFSDESEFPFVIAISENFSSIKKMTSKEDLADFLNSTFSFRKLGTKDDDDKDSGRYIAIPKEIVSTFFSDLAKYCNLQKVRHISGTPLFIEGKLLLEQGFNSNQEIIIKNNFSDEIINPLLLNEFLDKSPFLTDSDRDNFLGALSNGLFLMFDFAGHFPALIISANSPDSGKTTLAKCLEY